VGGDESAVIVQGEDYGSIGALLHTVDAHNAEAAHTGGIVIACGMSEYENDSSVSGVFARADRRMYECKKALKSVQSRETR
jgi:GGDEF domain-containing protein